MKKRKIIITINFVILNCFSVSCKSNSVTTTEVTSSTEITGPQGESGKSAYEIYMENYPHYPGNEKEWIEDLAKGKLSVTVDFNSLGGNEIDSIIYCKGEMIDTSNFKSPVKNGWIFTGWYLDEDLTKIIEDSFVAISDITLYASYTYNKDVTYEDIGVPVLNLDGDFSGISKTNKVKIKAAYDGGSTSFSCDATLKYQGATSINYPKKNYNIQLYVTDSNYSKKNKIELFEGYGKQSKYTLKANYIDSSMARNVVSAKIWGDVVRARKIQNELFDLPNCGAVDGYPILIFQNGEYQGLYTLNLSKEDYLFGMDDETKKQAIIFANDNASSSVTLHEHIAFDFSNGWDVEYCSTEDDLQVGTSWITTSFNEFIDFLNNNDGDELKNGLDQYVDIEAAIDTLLYVPFIYAEDNTAKNMLWVTYDGIKWIPSVYDMDGTYGLRWEGSVSYDTCKEEWFPYTANNLWEKIWNNYHDEIIERYKELRQGALSTKNINKKFSDFFESIPDDLYKAESKKWVDVPSQESNHETEIMSWITNKARTLDAFFNVTIEENVRIVTFDVDTEGTIDIYKTNNYSLKADRSLTTVARNSETGLIDLTDNGQVNFKVNVSDGYKIDKITVTGKYGQIIKDKDIDKTNIYCVKGIKSDLKIEIKLAKV